MSAMTPDPLAERLASLLAPYLVPCEPATGPRHQQAVSVAREVLAVVAERLPTEESLRVILAEEHGCLPDGTAYPMVERLAKALLRDWRERLGVKK